MAATEGRYQEKIKLGLVPTRYDRDSKSFQAGAWKNLTPQQRAINLKAIERRSRDG